MTEDEHVSSILSQFLYISVTEMFPQNCVSLLSTEGNVYEFVCSWMLSSKGNMLRGWKV